MSAPLVLRLGLHVSLPVSRRFLIVAAVLLTALVVSALTTLNIGTGQTAMRDVIAALFHPADSLNDAARAIAQFRLPRVAVAMFAGAMMAASGYLLQVVARNGLADPGILGLSDGATVAVLLAAALLGPLPVSQLGLVALVGALLTAGVVLGLGHRLLTGGGIILIGLSINIVLGSVVEIILISGSAARFSELLIWARGTLAGADPTDLSLLAGWFVVLVPLVLLTGRSLQPLLIGNEAALALGVPVRRMIVIYILLATAFAAPVVATCGPITFVGLMSAWIARHLVGERPTEVLLTSMLAGALILLWADTLGRWLFAPVIVSAGIMVSVVGAVTFILAARIAGRNGAGGSANL